VHSFVSHVSGVADHHSRPKQVRFSARTRSAVRASHPLSGAKRSREYSSRSQPRKGFLFQKNDLLRTPSGRRKRRTGPLACFARRAEAACHTAFCPPPDPARSAPTISTDPTCPFISNRSTSQGHTHQGTPCGDRHRFFTARNESDGGARGIEANRPGPNLAPRAARTPPATSPPEAAAHTPAKERTFSISRTVLPNRPCNPTGRAPGPPTPGESARFPELRDRTAGATCQGEEDPPTCPAAGRENRRPTRPGRLARTTGH